MLELFLSSDIEELETLCELPKSKGLEEESKHIVERATNSVSAFAIRRKIAKNLEGFMLYPMSKVSQGFLLSISLPRPRHWC